MSVESAGADLQLTPHLYDQVPNRSPDGDGTRRWGRWGKLSGNQSCVTATVEK